MKNLLLICGGRSEEHEISLISGKCILDAIDRKHFNPIVVGISKKGVWHLEEEDSFYQGEFRADKIRLNESAPPCTIAPFADSEGRGLLSADGRVVNFDVVFPILHGQYGEDGTIQGLFDTMGVPYVGADCPASAVCMDKVLTKTLVLKAGLKTAEFAWVISVKEALERREEIEKLGYPMFVKPARQGSSVGVVKVKGPTEYEAAFEEALKYDSKVLVERAISGREIETAVLGLRNNPKVASPGEILNEEGGWYSYEAKYLNPVATKVPADLDEKTAERCREFAATVFQLLEIDGMARIDLFVEEGTGDIYLNEPNTLPGFTPISMYPKMWEASGLSYANLIRELVRLAFDRLGRDWQS